MQVLREKAEAEGDVVAIMEIAARMFHGNGTVSSYKSCFPDFWADNPQLKHCSSRWEESKYQMKCF
jgi:hypothetical protein